MSRFIDQKMAANTNSATSGVLAPGDLVKRMFLHFHFILNLLAINRFMNFFTISPVHTEKIEKKELMEFIYAFIIARRKIPRAISAPTIAPMTETTPACTVP